MNCLVESGAVERSVKRSGGGDGIAGFGFRMCWVWEGVGKGWARMVVIDGGNR